PRRSSDLLLPLLAGLLSTSLERCFAPLSRHLSGQPGRHRLGLATFTVRARPPTSRPSRASIAFWAASAESISTHPNPRERPLSLSVMTWALTTSPYSPNSDRRSPSVVL